jgi:uncharacterized protein YceK
MKTFLALSACLLGIFELVCTSIAGRSVKAAPPVTYPAVQADWAGLHGGGEIPGWVSFPYCIIDLPFSAALDTVLLPYDSWRKHNDTNYWYQARTNSPPGAWSPEAQTKDR